MEKFELTLSFYEQLQARLEEKRKSFNSIAKSRESASGSTSSTEQYPADTIPTPADLKSLVETAFWTSLKREEGRALVLCN
jgi:hypothetical protein